jgi:putative ABC transport system permease protein
MRDVSLVLRSLARTKLVSAAAIVTLGVAIAATTLVFGALHGALFRPLPFAAPHELVLLSGRIERPGAPPRLTRWSFPEVRVLRTGAAPIGTLAAYNTGDANLVGEFEPERVALEIVTANYFDVLRVRTILGRTFLADEDSTPGTHPVALLSHGLWMRRMGGDHGVVGRSVRVNGVDLIVVGVLPPDFAGLSGRAALWIPQMMAPRVSFADQLTSGERFLTVVGRLADGVNVPRANVAWQSLGASLLTVADAEELGRDARLSVAVRALDEARVDPARRRTAILVFGGVWLVLLIACVNLASLQLARGRARAHELALRMALGAGRPRLVRQLLAESLVLAALGCAVAVALVLTAAPLLTALTPPRLPTPANDYGQLADFATLSADPLVLLFAVGVASLSAVGFGLYPAFRATRGDLARDLGQRGIALGGIGRFTRPGFLGLVVAAQMALALVLLTGAWQLMSTLLRESTRDRGFEPGGVLTFWMRPADPTFSTRDGPAQITPILERVRAIPGVRAASVSLCTPFMATCSRTQLFLEGATTDAESAPVVGRHYVAPEHFATLGIPLRRGRAFTDDDGAGRPRVTIVNETAARRLWPNEDPIGKRVWLSALPETAARADSAWEVVGVAGDVTYWPLDEPPGLDFYTPYRQHAYAFTMVMVKTAGDPVNLIPRIRSALAGVAPDVAPYDFRTLADRAGAALGGRRYVAVIVSTFAAIAMLVTAMGVFGTAAYSVAQRRREIGIQLALGALPRLVVSRLTRQMASLAGVGLVVGGVAAVALVGVLRALGGGGTPAPLIILPPAAVLAVLAVGTALAATRRATRIDPLEALRAE